jgi:hypothetical protein
MQIKAQNDRQRMIGKKDLRLSKIGFIRPSEIEERTTEDNAPLSMVIICGLQGKLFE